MAFAFISTLKEFGLNDNETMERLRAKGIDETYLKAYHAQTPYNGI
ncbi:hypothetical protein LQZ18_10925 [Lachnospiraceae bacterium ZAX-1]